MIQFTREEVRNIATGLKTYKEIDSFKEEEVRIIEEFVTILEKERETVPVLTNVPKKKLLEVAVKVDKGLSRFNTHSITKTNELFFEGAVGKE